MSNLVYDSMEPSHIIDKVTSLDEYGSVVTKWVEGAPIDVSYSFDASTTARIAAQEGVKNRYKLMTKRAIVLQPMDVIRRDEDGKIFRITSDSKDNKTPTIAGLDLRAVEAEEWELPKDE